MSDRADGVRQGRDSAGRPADEGLARFLSELSRRLQSEPDLSAVLSRIVAAAVTEIGRAEYAGIMLGGRDNFHTAAQSDPLVAEIDRIQYHAGDGPCIQSSRLHETVVSNDLVNETRWPQFCAQALEMGIRSVLSLELFAGPQEFGALNIYSRHPDAFDQAAESAGLLLASHAALAMNATGTEEGLREALNSRDLIGQAKGILMERHRLTSAQAFDLMVAASQHHNRKLRDIAARIVHTGEFAFARQDSHANPSDSLFA